jgi:hypothetical protein
MKTGEKSYKGHIRFYDVFQKLLDHMPARSQEIVEKRFGVIEKEPLTLQKIGDEYGITRERVRQIVQSGLKSVYSADHDDFLVIKEAIIDLVCAHHGIVPEPFIIDSLGGDDFSERGSVRFFIEGISDIDIVNAKKYPVENRVIIVKSFDINKWHAVHETVKNVLQDKNAVHTSSELHGHISGHHADVEHEQLVKYLHVSREIANNPFDKWGLVEWDEISPRGVREKALLVMKENNKPMHFREIAEAIDRHGLGKNGRKSHPQTVHNELIRDDNFVLVGRGVYALNTGQYIKGTVKDVIEDVLRRSTKPLSAEEIVDQVLAIRYVKPSTVKVNLNTVAKKLTKEKKYTLDTKST